MDFTDPLTLLLRLKAIDDDRIFYCSRAAIKTFTLNEASMKDVIELDVKADDLLIFLHAMNDPRGIWKVVAELSVVQKIALIRTMSNCGVGGSLAFDSFHTVIFESFEPKIPRKAWKKVAKSNNLVLYKEEDAIKVLALYPQALEEANRLEILDQLEDQLDLKKEKDDLWKPSTFPIIFRSNR